MSRIRSKICSYLLPILIAVTLPLFFYKLGQGSLVSWDEAWYAEIARNILRNHDFIHLIWNGKPYIDHPPFGFWLIATSIKALGVSTFSVRLPSAILGLSSLYLLYFLGQALFNKWVGFFSAIALSSSSWFLLRSRSGNLDTLLVFMFLLAFLLAVKLTENRKYLIPFLISMTLLFLTKTLVPFTILPALVVVFFRKSVFRKKDVLLILLFFLLPVTLWFLSQILVNNEFINRYLSIGYPGVSMKSSFLSNILLTKMYIYNGIGHWFWYSVAAVCFSFFFFQRRFNMMIVFIGVFLLPFIYSPRGQIWHLIPLHPFMILSLFAFLYLVSRELIGKYAILLLLIVFIYVGVPQFKRNWYEIVDTSPYVSDEEILSREAGKYNEQYLIDDSFMPTAVFYSGKYVEQIGEGAVKSIFQNKKPFILFTYQWRLDKAGIKKSEYEIIKKDRDKILVRSL